MIETNEIVSAVISAMGDTSVTVYPDVTGRERATDRHAHVEVSSVDDVIPGNFTYRVNLTLMVYAQPDVMTVDAISALRAEMADALLSGLQGLKNGTAVDGEMHWRCLDYVIYPATAAKDESSFRMAIPFEVVAQG